MTKGKFPNGLREALDAMNMGVTELARRIETSKQNVDRWANGERALKPEMAAKIAPILMVTPAALLLLPEPAKTDDASSKHGKHTKMEADTLASLRAALIAYGVDKTQLGTLLPVIDRFKTKAKPEQSEQTGSHGQSQPANHRRVE